MGFLSSLKHPRPARPQAQQVEQHQPAEQRSHAVEARPAGAGVSHSEDAPPSLENVWSDGLGRFGSRAAQILLIGVVAWFVIQGLMSVSVIFIALVVATILGCALRPVVRWLKKEGMNNVFAAVTTFVGSILVLSGVIYLVVESVVRQSGQLAQQAVSGVSTVQNWVNELPFSISNEQIQQWQDKALETLSSSTSQVSQQALTGLSAVGNFATGFVLMAVCLFFFLLDGPRIWRFFVDFVPSRYEDKFLEAGKGTVKVLGQYIRGTAAVASIDAVFIGTGLVVLGVPLAIPLAILTFLGAFIPVVGAVIGGILAALVALVTKGLTTAIIVTIIVVLVQQIEGNILQPRLMGDALSLHGLVILLTLAAGSTVGGIAGAVLAVPMAAVGWHWIKVFRGRGAPVMPEDEVKREKKRQKEAEKAARKEHKRRQRELKNA
ncbi:AI-2E family transporter [Falsarthrobacter nasiphocae]|uniref:PurR-regulated permease PerM n=1 Tax=Falsarthrobacter nasiphocae TaxID=189863 RepID=A0AAE4C8A3_9MICC|nr:AI-2E family transporter [Falsarthrobacter nasiphocae]MDR6892195.1 putative PurR-regulated permease PerM [Falsarthrobacter nasiphocae]